MGSKIEIHTHSSHNMTHLTISLLQAIFFVYAEVYKPMKTVFSVP
jgi:hypothetical protein